jgi:hypothetical protein
MNEQTSLSRYKNKWGTTYEILLFSVDLEYNINSVASQL